MIQSANLCLKSNIKLAVSQQRENCNGKTTALVHRGIAWWHSLPTDVLLSTQVFMAVFSLMEELRGAYIEAYINIGDTSSADFEDVLYSKFFFL